jgi:hypothetical protein
LSEQLCLLWTERLLAVTLLLQTVELWQLRHVWADDGVWSWQVLQQEHGALPMPLRALFALILPCRAFRLLLLARGLLALALGAGWGLAAPGLLVTQLAIGVRFRGTFNGGSDYMSVAVLLGLCAAVLGHRSPLLVKAGLAYVCVQLVLSYFIAGAVKVVRADWRNGRALSRLLASNRYGTPPWLAAVLTRPAAAPVAAWLVLSFELSFPVAILSGRFAVAWLVLGALFHVGNVVAFGLNRFFFAWLCAYPALLYFSHALVR